MTNSIPPLNFVDNVPFPPSAERDLTRHKIRLTYPTCRKALCAPTTIDGKPFVSALQVIFTISSKNFKKGLLDCYVLASSTKRSLISLEIPTYPFLRMSHMLSFPDTTIPSSFFRKSLQEIEEAVHAQDRARIDSAIEKGDDYVICGLITAFITSGKTDTAIETLPTLKTLSEKKHYDLLHVAAEYGNEFICRRLVEDYGLSAATFDKKNKETAMHAAVRGGDLSTIS